MSKLSFGKEDSPLANPQPVKWQSWALLIVLDASIFSLLYQVCS